MSVRLYFGNLPKDLEREAFEALFSEQTNDLLSVKLISDRKTGKCRGFGFVTAKDEATAQALVEKYNGSPFQDSVLKVEMAAPRTKEDEDEGREANHRRGKRSSRRGENTMVVSETKSDNGPDPRWAEELAKLKEMLAAQTTPS